MSSSPAVVAELLSCCASQRWAQSVAEAWPYRSQTELLTAAEAAFDRLEREDWLEAFAAHARIGEPRADDARGSSEQSGIGAAADSERSELAALNAEYDRRFGHVFLICASGLSATQMLSALRQRIDNGGEAEFRIATCEQRKITSLRLADRFAP